MTKRYHIAQCRHWRRAPGSLLLCLLLLAVAINRNAQAQTHASIQHDDGETHTNELVLWKVTKEGLQPSFVLGLVHVLPQSMALGLFEAITPYMQGADKLLTELVVDRRGLKAMTKALRYPLFSRKRLASQLKKVLGKNQGAALYRDVYAVLNDVGDFSDLTVVEAPQIYSHRELNRKTPAAIREELAIHYHAVHDNTDVGVSLDDEIKDEFSRKERNNTIVALEKGNEQIPQMVTDTAAEIRETVHAIRGMIDVIRDESAHPKIRERQAEYIRGEAEQLEKGNDVELRLGRNNAKRDIQMFKRALKHFKQGNVFAAIGLAHLHGNGNGLPPGTENNIGVLGHLRNAGFTVEPEPIKITVKKPAPPQVFGSQLRNHAIPDVHEIPAGEHHVAATAARRDAYAVPVQAAKPSKRFGHAFRGLLRRITSVQSRR